MITVTRSVRGRDRIVKLQKVTEQGLTVSELVITSRNELLELINNLRDAFGDWCYDDLSLKKLRIQGENL